MNRPSPEKLVCLETVMRPARPAGAGLFLTASRRAIAGILLPMRQFLQFSRAGELIGGLVVLSAISALVILLAIFRSREPQRGSRICEAAAYWW